MVTIFRESDDDNFKVCELPYRRVDIADVVLAHVCAMREAKRIGWAKYVISAPHPSDRKEGTLDALNDGRAGNVIEQIRPKHAEALLRHKWKLRTNMDRVYDSFNAVKELGRQSVLTFDRAVECIESGTLRRENLLTSVCIGHFEQGCNGSTPDIGDALVFIYHQERNCHMKSMAASPVTLDLSLLSTQMEAGSIQSVMLNDLLCSVLSEPQSGGRV